jgi:hypothetical protein
MAGESTKAICGICFPGSLDVLGSRRGFMRTRYAMRTPWRSNERARRSRLFATCSGTRRLRQPTGISGGWEQATRSHSRALANGSFRREMVTFWQGTLRWPQ